MSWRSRIVLAASKQLAEAKKRLSEPVPVDLRAYARSPAGMSIARLGLAPFISRVTRFGVRGGAGPATGGNGGSGGGLFPRIFPPPGAPDPVPIPKRPRTPPSPPTPSGPTSPGSGGSMPFHPGDFGPHPFGPLPGPGGGGDPFGPLGPNLPAGPNGGSLCDGISNFWLRQLCKQGSSFLPGEECTQLRRSLGLCPDGNGQSAGGGGGGFSPCAPGTIRVGNTCVSPGDFFPGGDPFTTPAGGGTTVGAFGLPAVVPAQVQRVRRVCPTGMVLGRDNLCYPRQILPRNSRYRKWRPGARPPISAGDWKALKRMKRTKAKARDIAETAGGTVKGLPR